MMQVILLIVLALVPFASGITGDGSEKHPYEYFILEELPAHTNLGNVAIDAGLKEEYGAETLSKFRFSFLNQDSLKQQLFAIDDRTGIIETVTVIDRDVICPHEITCLVYLDVAIQPADYFQVIKILLDILDINDHTPAFPSDRITLTIPESALIGTSYDVPMATDPDSASYDVQKYEMSPDLPQFELKLINSIDGGAELKLTLKQKVDREEKEFYQLEVMAHDGGSPSKSGSMQININIEDTNDNDPKFVNATYEVFVMENVPAGTTVAKVVAKDPDSGLNGELVYSFTDRTRKNYGNLFEIVNETGAIYLKESLDFEKGSTYLLVVAAHDRGLESQPAQTTVIVRVEDVNDNAPHITVNTLTRNGVAQISEKSTIGTFVAHVSVSDLDGGDNGKLECTLVHDKFDLQTIYSTQYKVVTTAKLDREKTALYHLSLECHDGGSDPKIAEKKISVRVMDENDNAPVFSKDIYETYLRENNFVDEVVVQVNATDADEGKNAKVEYDLHPDVKDLFAIEPNTGLITAKVTFDHEQIKHFEFQVLAMDHGQPQLKGITTVKLNVVDLNDEPPTFSQSSYAFGTFENEPVNSEIGKVGAVDPDSAPNSNFEYKFVNPLGVSARDFAIDPLNGRIVTRISLDREKQSVYYLTVVANNKGFPPLSSSVSVTIYVADKNDNEPNIKYPAPGNDTVYISNKVPQGYKVTQIKATDEDIGSNGKLTYSITQGNEREIFEMDIFTGIITVSQDLHETSHEVHDLRITIRDNGDPPHMALTRLNIVVNKTIPYIPKDTTKYVDSTVAIIVSFTSVALLLFFLLILAVLLLQRQGTKLKVNKYKYRNVAQKIVSCQDDRDKEVPDGKESSATNLTLSDGIRLSPNKERGLCLDIDVLGDEETPRLARHWGSNLHKEHVQIPPSTKSYTKQEIDAESHMSSADSGHGSCGENDIHNSFHNNSGYRQGVSPSSFTLSVKTISDTKL